MQNKIDHYLIYQCIRHHQYAYEKLTIVIHYILPRYYVDFNICIKKMLTFRNNVYIIKKRVYICVELS